MEPTTEVMNAERFGVFISRTRQTLSEWMYQEESAGRLPEELNDIELDELLHLLEGVEDKVEHYCNAAATAIN